MHGNESINFIYLFCYCVKPLKEYTDTDNHTRGEGYKYFSEWLVKSPDPWANFQIQIPS